MKHLEKSGSTSLREIDKCLVAPAVGYFPKREDKLEILGEIKNLFMAFGVDRKPEALKLIMADMLEKYPAESVEDLKLCLKRGRQGSYSEKIFGTNFNMQIFSSWMGEHLENKYFAKEEAIKLNKKAASKPWTNKAEYMEAARVGGLVSQMLTKAKEDKKRKDAEYNNFKMEYLANKK